MLFDILLSECPSSHLNVIQIDRFIMLTVVLQLHVKKLCVIILCDYVGQWLKVAQQTTSCSSMLIPSFFLSFFQISRNRNNFII